VTIDVGADYRNEKVTGLNVAAVGRKTEDRGRRVNTRNGPSAEPSELLNRQARASSASRAISRSSIWYLVRPII